MPAKAYHTVVAHDAMNRIILVFWSFGRGYGPRLDTHPLPASVLNSISTACFQRCEMTSGASFEYRIKAATTSLYPGKALNLSNVSPCTYRFIDCGSYVDDGEFGYLNTTHH